VKRKLTDVPVQNFKNLSEQWPQRWDHRKERREIRVKNPTLLISAALTFLRNRSRNLFARPVCSYSVASYCVNRCSWYVLHSCQHIAVSSSWYCCLGHVSAHVSHDRNKINAMYSWLQYVPMTRIVREVGGTSGTLHASSPDIIPHLVWLTP
jgi:hypothetical protein